MAKQVRVDLGFLGPFVLFFVMAGLLILSVKFVWWAWRVEF